jgi:hypothetical protein
MNRSFRLKAIVVLLVCVVVFGLNALVVLWLRSTYQSELYSLPWYESYVTYRTLLLRPFMLFPFGLFVALCLLKIGKNRSKGPAIERQQLYLLALLSSVVLGFVLLALFKL